jgi:hypothetical protein
LSQRIGLNKEIIEMEQYYEKHRGYYGMAFQKTIGLETYLAALKKLSIRWVENRKSSMNADRSRNNENLRKDSIDKIEPKNLFVIDNELAELSDLTEGLKGFQEVSIQCALG